MSECECLSIFDILRKWLLRLSPPEDQAGVTHAISPIWIKLGQIKELIPRL